MQLSNQRRAAESQPKFWTDARIREFRSSLLAWFDQARRDLPWRRSNDPYRVWVSEIMLQQTRVTAAIPYYERFLERFPSVEALAEAPEADLLAHWAGLGYYHRARNMQQAARAIRDAGGFPRYARGNPGTGRRGRLYSRGDCQHQLRLATCGAGRQCVSRAQPRGK